MEVFWVVAFAGLCFLVMAALYVMATRKEPQEGSPETGPPEEYLTEVTPEVQRDLWASVNKRSTR